MAGESIKCPHCECKVKVADVEKEDGYCPECGQLVMASSLQNDFDNDTDDDEFDDMDAEYESEDSWDDEDEQPDILDELNNDDAFLDDEGSPRKHRHPSGKGFHAPKSNPSPKKGKKK
ncbi:MAG: hypothetical protein ACI4SG_01000 [Oligosphaeraceae bacterium]